MGDQWDDRDREPRATSAPRNPVTNPVTQSVVTRGVTPPHTTPHHTTKEPTSVASDQLARGAATITARIRATPQAEALARLITDLRPDWPADDVYAWAMTDDRPWAVVVQAGITRCTDRDIRQPAGLRYVGPAATAAAPRIPTVAEWRAARRCDHGEVEGQCALCRRHIPADHEERA